MTHYVNILVFNQLSTVYLKWASTHLAQLIIKVQMYYFLQQVPTKLITSRTCQDVVTSRRKKAMTKSAAWSSFTTRANVSPEIELKVNTIIAMLHGRNQFEQFVEHRTPTLATLSRSVSDFGARYSPCISEYKLGIWFASTNPPSRNNLKICRALLPKVFFI